MGDNAEELLWSTLKTSTTIATASLNTENDPASSVTTQHSSVTITDSLIVKTKKGDAESVGTSKSLDSTTISIKDSLYAKKDKRNAETAGSSKDNFNSSSVSSMDTTSSNSSHPQVHQCEICQAEFPFLRRLKQHKKIHNKTKDEIVEARIGPNFRHTAQDNPYQCQQCGKRYKDKKKLGKHMRAHISGRLFECEKCQLCFAQKSGLMQHIKNPGTAHKEKDLTEGQDS